MKDVVFVVACCAVTLIGMRDDMANSQEQNKVRQTAQALVDKLDVIEKDPNYNGVWTMAAIHGYHYTGPNYIKELAALKEALGKQ